MFLMDADDRQWHRIKIVEAIEDHQESVNRDPNNLRFRCSINEDKCEEIMSCNDILAHSEKDDDNPIIWKFKRIIAHEGPLTEDHHNCKGSSCSVRIECENGEITDEPLSMIAADDPVTFPSMHEIMSCSTHLDGNVLLA